MASNSYQFSTPFEGNQFTVHVGDKLLLLERQILEQNLFTDPNLSMEELCQKTDINARKLRELLKKKRQMNFPEFINSFRVKRFLEIMESGAQDHLSIWGIAQDVGFQSKSTFYQAFRKVTGTTPTSYYSHS